VTLADGAPWPDLPERYGPRQTVHEWRARREADGTPRGRGRFYRPKDVLRMPGNAVTSSPQLLAGPFATSAQRACVLVGCNPDRSAPRFPRMADLQNTMRDNLRQM